MKVFVTKEEKVHISTAQAKDITIEYFKEEYKLNPHMWVEDGILKEDYEVYGSHSWTETQDVRKASDVDKLMLKALKEVFFDKPKPKKGK